MTLTDQLHRSISINEPIKSVISLVPSHTELLFDLGLHDFVIGRTKFCIHPSPEIRNIPIIGGTKNIQIETIKSLNPDLIIANKEENIQTDVLTLAKDYPVWISDIKTLEDSFEMTQEIAALFNVTELGKSIQNRTISKIQSIASKQSMRAAYLIWNEPFMTIGSDTYIHHILDHLGFENVFANHTRYPEVSIEDIKAAQPELILLSSEPFPFKEIHKIQFKTIFKGTQIEIVDGEVFSWYGSRIIHKNKF